MRGEKMVFELYKDKFKNVFKIIDSKWDNIEIKSVLAGNNPGWVFVDSLVNPRTALVWSKGIRGFYFVGDPGNPEFNPYINKCIDDIIRNRAIESGLDCFEFSGDCIEWDGTLEKIFEHRGLEKSHQCVYKLNQNKWEQHKNSTLDEKFTLRRVDNELLNDANIRNLEFITAEITKWWDTLEDYMNNTFGYCIIDNDIITSYCLTNFVFENTHTIGIETLEDYKRKGLARVTSEAFIFNCIITGLNPYWDCMYTNNASRSLVEKLEFYLDHVYSLYRFPLK